MRKANPIEQLNAFISAGAPSVAGAPRWQRYYEPIAGLSRGLPIPILAIMVMIWQLREDDLQQLYPLSTKQGRLDFIAWCVAHGQREYRALDEATRFWSALAQPAHFSGVAMQPNDAGHALSWHMVMLARSRVDLGFDLATPDGRLALLYWYLVHGNTEHGPPGQSLAPWQTDYLLAPGAAGYLSRLQAFIHQARRDLRSAFALPGDIDAYLAWFDHFIRIDTRIIDLLHSSDSEPAPPAPPAMPNGVNVVGHAYGQLGIGEDARMAVKALSTTALPVVLLDFPAGATIPQGDFSMAPYVASSPRYATNVFCLTAQEHGRCFAERGSALLAGRYNIGYWPWELAKWPSEWQHLFALADEIWVSSQHTLEAIVPVSPVPVRLMPMAVEIPPVGKRRRAEFGLPERAYLFLFAFDLNSSARRKNPHACLAAFLRAFPRQGKHARTAESVGLVIKVHPPSKPNPDWEDLKALQEGDPRIYLIEETLEKPELLALYRACDCYVSLHRAEGFGRSIAEAMLLDRPVVTTAYSGNLGFTTSDNSFLVDYALTALDEGDYPHGAGQVWAEPKIAHAARQLRSILERPGRAAAQARRGGATIRTQHGAKLVGARYAAALAHVRPGLPLGGTVSILPRFFVCDQAATGLGGHYLYYSRCVALAARARGFSPELLCAAGLDRQLLQADGLPCHSVYGLPWPGPDSTHLPAFGPGHMVFDTQAALHGLGAGGADHVLLATLSLVEMRAWIAYFVALPLYQLRRMPVYHLLLRFDPAALEEDGSAEWARLRRRLGERSGTMGAQLNWCSDTEQLAQRYAQQLGVAVAVVPIPFDQTALLHALRNRARPAPRAVTVLYLGDARPEKGFEALPAMLAALWASHVAPGKLRFVFQCNLNVPGGQGGVAAALLALAAYPTPMVELVHSPMTPDQYARHLAECDIVLLPYCPQRYRARSSGILVEALGAGKPVLTTRESWLASQLDASQAELVDSSAELSAGLLRLVARLPAARCAAEAAAARWRAYASPAGFVQRLLVLAPHARSEAPMALCVLDGAALAQRSGDAQASLARLRYLLACQWRVAVLLVAAPDGLPCAALDDLPIDLWSWPSDAAACVPWTHTKPDLLLFDRPHALELRDRLGLSEVATVCAVGDADLPLLHADAGLCLSLARCRHLFASMPTVKAALAQVLPQSPCSTLPAAVESLQAGPSQLAGAVSLAALLQACVPDQACSTRAARLAVFGDRIDLLYVGSASAANLAGLRWFIDAVYLPSLAPAGITLLVAGAIGRAVPWPDCPSLIFLGPVRTLAPLYAAAKLCVLPVTVESANAKTAQALAYGKPAVGTSMAVAGLAPPLAASVECADSPADLARAIVHVLGQPALRHHRAQQLCAARYGAAAAAQFARTMDKVLERKGRRTPVPWPTPVPSEWEPAIGYANACLLAWLAPPDALAGAPSASAARLEVGGPAWRHALRSMLPPVLACDALGGMSELSAKRLLEVPDRALAVLRELVAPAVVPRFSGGALRARPIIHGAVASTLLVELRRQDGAAAAPPRLLLILDGLEIDLPLQQDGVGRLLGRHAFRPDAAFPFLRPVGLEIRLSPASGWCIATALLQEEIGLAALRQSAAPNAFHAAETTLDGKPFAWTAQPSIDFDLPCSRGVDKLLLLDTHGLGRNPVAVLGLLVGGRRYRFLQQPSSGSQMLAACLGADPIQQFGSRATLLAPNVARASASDARKIGIALCSMRLISQLLGSEPR